MPSVKHLTRSARLVVLRDLRRAGYLEGMTLQQIADRLGGLNRSTILASCGSSIRLRRKRAGCWSYGSPGRPENG